MQEFHWTHAGNGVSVSETGPCRLTVAVIGGLPRFLVHRQALDAADRPASLVASGTRPSLPAAAAAAEATANRIAMAEGLHTGARR